MYVCVFAVRTLDCWLIQCFIYKVLVGRVVHFTFFCCFTIVFIIIVHAFILSTIPWNRIGSHNLFSFRSLCMGMLSSAYVCIVLCNAMHCSLYQRNKCAMWNEKGTQNTFNGDKQKANSHTHNQFFFGGFFIIMMFLFFFSSLHCFYFIWNWLLRFFPFHFQCITHCIKGKEWRSYISNACRIREWIEYNVHCMVERAHFMWVRCCVVLLFDDVYFHNMVESLGWNSKGNEYPRMRYFLSDW